jgi:predicted nucleic acid-binding protein
VSEAAERHAVVLDVNVLIDAVVHGNSPFTVWPNIPPVSDNPAADCLGVVNDAREFTLWLSEHILENTVRVLCDAEDSFGWEPAEAEEYVEVLVEIAQASGGDVATPSQALNDCSDYEDNRVLELALEVDAALIVSSDHHLLEMSPWRGRPILSPREFAGRVDAVRRTQRR